MPACPRLPLVKVFVDEHSLDPIEEGWLVVDDGGQDFDGDASTLAPLLEVQARMCRGQVVKGLGVKGCFHISAVDLIPVVGRDFGF